MTEIANKRTEEKNHMDDSKHILSYLSFLEKIYEHEQSQDKSLQERLFRISKAINSIKKYYNCQVSSFNSKPKKTSENANSDSPKVDEQGNNINEVLHLIEKELKQNGINEGDINNSLLSTSKKSLNNSENEPNSKIDSNKSENLQNFPKTKLNQKRLSKLFLKIELKLKTFIQEDNMKKALMEEEKIEQNTINEKEENKDKINCFSIGKKMERSPSKLPNVIDSFFSDKNRVNSILQNVKKQRRKSVIEFNNKLSQFSRDDKNEYIVDSANNGSKKYKNKKRKKIVPCSAQVVMRNKITKNSTSEKVSNFCDMIDEKEEEREYLDDINAFNNKIDEEEIKGNIAIKNNNNNDKNMINVQSDSSIKIVSSLNNRNIPLNYQSNNNDNVINNNKKEGSSCDTNNIFVAKKSVFLNENCEKEKEENNELDNALLDDEILMDSSDEEELDSYQDENSKNSKESKGSESASYKSESEKNSKEDEKYNALKYINDSKNRTGINGDEDNNGKSVSCFSKNNFLSGKSKHSVEREIERASNINGFCMNSIFSPLKKKDICEKRVSQNNVIEQFSRLK
jgi:hypothetical protein